MTKLSHLVGMKDVATAVIIIFGFPCWMELEKEESCVCRPCIRGGHKTKEVTGDLHRSLLPPRSEDAILLNAALSFERRV